MNNITVTDIFGMPNTIAIYLSNLNFFLYIKKYYVKFNVK